mgnify:CR=1 FL=1
MTERANFWKWVFFSLKFFGYVVAISKQMLRIDGKNYRYLLGVQRAGDFQALHYRVSQQVLAVLTGQNNHMHNGSWWLCSAQLALPKPAGTPCNAKLEKLEA